ncbi:MAG: efflux RND transporter permease subunit [Planctomycetota bacterium]|nr:MAG: efflux RND transporter permease subunit [Planctomycetota bacterium]
MSMIGMVILVGVVVNNAIVLIDRIKQLEGDFANRKQAILQAGRERLRPILITALTTLAGLLPMALGSSNIIGRPYYPLGRAVIGGLFSSTLLTLFVVPLLYLLLSRFQDLLKGILGMTSPTVSNHPESKEGDIKP